MPGRFRSGLDDHRGEALRSRARLFKFVRDFWLIRETKSHFSPTRMNRLTESFASETFLEMVLAMPPRVVSNKVILVLPS